MVASALEPDKEDTHDDHLSHAVSAVTRDEDPNSQTGDKGGVVAVRLNSGIEGIVGKGYLLDALMWKSGICFRKAERSLQLYSTSRWSQRQIPSGFRCQRDSSTSLRETASTGESYRTSAGTTANTNATLSRIGRSAEANQTRRIIKHPNFHNFNSTQAEAYLDKQHQGDVVIRPSPMGQDHLVVIWKVDDKLYQHIGTFASSMSVSRC